MSDAKKPQTSLAQLRQSKDQGESGSQVIYFNENPNAQKVFQPPSFNSRTARKQSSISGNDGHAYQLKKVAKNLKNLKSGGRMKSPLCLQPVTPRLTKGKNEVLFERITMDRQESARNLQTQMRTKQQDDKIAHHSPKKFLIRGHKKMQVEK